MCEASKDTKVPNRAGTIQRRPLFSSKDNMKMLDDVFTTSLFSAYLLSFSFAFLIKLGGQEVQDNSTDIYETTKSGKAEIENRKFKTAKEIERSEKLLVQACTILRN